MDFSKQVSALKVRTLLTAVCCVCVISIGYSYFFVPNFHFLKLSQDNIDNQLENIETLLVASRTHTVPLLLFDIDILPNIFVPRSKTWKDTLHQCKILCKHHPEEKNVITFAALATKFIASKEDYINSLKHLGFTVHLSEVADPKQKGHSNPDMIPAYLWMARKKHVIHIAFLHERGDDIKYMWVGPVTDQDWMETVAAITPAIGEGWHSIDAVGAKFPRYAQGYDLSHRFTGLPIYIDNHRISVPYHIRAFLDEYANSRFIECDHAKAENFVAKYEIEIPQQDKLFQEAAKKMLVETKKIFEKIKVPFWITGGTVLGWYRQCNIISYDTNIDIGIWKHDYKEEIISAMEENGFFFKSKFGTLKEGLELAFLDKSDTKINIHVFSNGHDHVTHLRTRKDGKRFLFSYPPFELCWSEFVGIKVKVYCDSLMYVSLYFGPGWYKPQKDWLWYVNSNHAIPMGHWTQHEWKSVMQVHHRESKKENLKK
uniref:fukutin-like n=1 Tax=Styela clava TaxID=7725 RepID=UPI001939CDAE|nr:fukutin-like [Styela clava]